MPKFRRGAAAIEEAAQGGGSQKFRSFAPSISWTGEEMEKFILILTPIDEVVGVDYHGFIPVSKGRGKAKYRYEDFISRKDESVGEDSDYLEDELDREPSRKIIGVGVELDATYKTVKGRKKPTGFTAATRTYTKRGNDGEEEVEVSKIGLIVQSSGLMWQPLKSLDNSKGPLEFLPLQIKREGTGQKTDYTIIDFDGEEVDLSPVIETLDGLSYLSEKKDDILAEIDALEDEDFGVRAAQVVARTLLDTRLEELIDGDRYEELTSNIRYLPPAFTQGDPKFYNANGPTESRDEGEVEDEAEAKPKSRTRPARKSQRTKKREEVVEATEEDAEEEVEEKPKSQKSRFDELRASMAAKQTEKAGV